MKQPSLASVGMSASQGSGNTAWLNAALEQPLLFSLKLFWPFTLKKNFIYREFYILPCDVIIDTADNSVKMLFDRRTWSK